MSDRRLALDIGGANLKAAHADGPVRTIPFELWKDPAGLAGALRALAGSLPDADAWLVTMTGELCDCFRTRSDGIRSILASTREAADGRIIRVWGIDGAFHEVAAVLDRPLLAAASNWLALATAVARGGFGPSGLLIDVGSTTTDLIPWANGRVPIHLDQRTDFERLKALTLVYAGVRRTPLMALGPISYRREWIRPMAELFATTADVFLTLGELPADPDDRSTANGRPFTVDESRDRLARMLGRDRDDFPPEEALRFARSCGNYLALRLASDAGLVARRSLGDQIETVIVAGSGEFFARRVADRACPLAAVHSLGDAWGREASVAACAVALLRIAAEGDA